MALVIELKPDEEMQLEQCAQAEGVSPADYVRRLVTGDLQRATQRAKNQAAIDLLESWVQEAENATDEERQQADAEWRASMRDLDEHRLSARKLFPELAETQEAEKTA